MVHRLSGKTKNILIWRPLFDLRFGVNNLLPKGYFAGTIWVCHVFSMGGLVYYPKETTQEFLGRKPERQPDCYSCCLLVLLIMSILHGVAFIGVSSGGSSSSRKSSNLIHSFFVLLSPEPCLGPSLNFH